MIALGVVLLALFGLGLAGLIGWGLGTRQERGRLARYEEVSEPVQSAGRTRGVKMRTVKLTR